MSIQIHYWTYDVDKNIKYYTNQLGFTLDYREPLDGPTAFCILKLNDDEVMFGCAPKDTENPVSARMQERIGNPGPIAVYIGVPDVSKVYENCKTQGAEIIETLHDTPWGLKCFSVIDPDQNVMTFTSPSN